MLYSSENFIIGIGDRFIQDYPPGSGSNWSYVHLKAQADGCKFSFMTTWIHSGHQWGDLNAADPGTGGWLKRSDVLKVAEDGYIPLIAFWWFGDSITPDYVNSTMSSWLSAIDNLSKLIDIGSDYEVWILLEPEFNKGGIENWEGWNDAVITAINRFKSNMKNGTKLKIGVSVGDWGLYPETYHLQDCLSRAAPYCDYIAFHTMRGSTKDDHKWEGINNPVPEVIIYSRELARYLGKIFKRPIFLSYFSISSYGGWEQNQATIVDQMFDYRAEFMNYKMLGLGYFNYFDDPQHGGYYGAAEPYMGLVYSNLAKKPAWYVWKERTDDIYNNTGQCSVAIVYPEGGEVLTTATAEVKILAVGNISNKTYSLYISSDDGKNYMLLKDNISMNVTTYLLDISTYVTDVSYRLKVITSDGAEYETRKFAINLGKGKLYGDFDFENSMEGWKIPSFDVNAIKIERSSDVASYGKYSLKCITRHSKQSSVTKIGAIEFLNIDLTNDPNKTITMDVYLPFEFGPALGVTRATIFWHDKDFKWQQGASEYLLSSGWNRISVDVSQTAYPIRSVGIKLVSDLPMVSTFYIDHVIVGSSPQDDKDSPIVNILNPLDNSEAYLSNIYLSGTVEDNVGISTCYFRINGNYVSSLVLVDGIFNKQMSLSYGENLIEVYAEDYSGNIGSSSIKVNLVVPVNNPPIISIADYENGQVISGTATIRVFIEDDDGVDRVEFYLNNNFKFVVSSPPYSWIWDTRSCSNGSYILKVIAYDTFLQSSEVSLILKVENLGEDNLPNIIILSPEPAMKVVDKKLKIYSNITDERGISKVEYYINNSLVFLDTSEKEGLYEFEYDISNFISGIYYIKLVAYDTSNQSVSLQQSIYIDNPQKKFQEFLLSPNGDGINDVVSFSTSGMVEIYDINGIPIASVAAKQLWDGKDSNGNVVGSGVYIFREENSGTSGTIIVTK